MSDGWGYAGSIINFLWQSGPCGKHAPASCSAQVCGAGKWKCSQSGLRVSINFLYWATEHFCWFSQLGEGKQKAWSLYLLSLAQELARSMPRGRWKWMAAASMTLLLETTLIFFLDYPILQLLLSPKQVETPLVLNKHCWIGNSRPHPASFPESNSIRLPWRVREEESEQSVLCGSTSSSWHWVTIRGLGKEDLYSFSL